MKNHKAKRSGFELIFIPILIFIGFVLFAWSWPYFKGFQARSLQRRCAFQLEYVGRAMILYSDEYRYFPHMKLLAESQSEDDVCRSYRTLIYFSFLEDPALLKCPTSKRREIAVKPSDAKRFHWDGELSQATLAPVFEAPQKPLFENHALSYTGLQRKLNSLSVRSDTLLAADKEIEGLSAEDAGCHRDGVNLIHADGHVDFVPTAETAVMNRLTARLHMGAGFGFDHI